MKPRIAMTLLCLAAMAMSGCDIFAPQTPTPTSTPTETPTSTPTNTPRPTSTFTPRPSPTPTLDLRASLIGGSAYARGGPALQYDQVAAITQDDLLYIVGKNDDCSWLSVLLEDGKIGWVRADVVDFIVPCDLITLARIPPTPTAKPYVPPTPTPCTGQTVQIAIVNNTGGVVNLNLKGPCAYTFSLKTGNSSINILPGNYSFTAYGCGGASLSGSKTLNAGDEWTWYCQ